MQHQTRFTIRLFTILNTKFEHSKYGLRLKLTATNDNERALINDLLKTGAGVKLKNMVVRPGETAHQVEVIRPVFISGEIIAQAGFSNDLNTAIGKQIYVQVRSGKTYLLVGCGFYTLYVLDFDFGFEIVEATVSGDIIVFNPGNEAEPYNLPEAPYTSDKINLAEQLDDLLLKY